MAHLCFGDCLGTPNSYNLSEKYWRYTSNLYRNTPLICNAVPRWLLSFGERENAAIHLQFVVQYASNLYRSTPPICTGDTFERPPGVEGSGKFLISFCLVRIQMQLLIYVCIALSRSVISYLGSFSLYLSLSSLFLPRSVGSPLLSLSLSFSFSFFFLSLSLSLSLNYQWSNISLSMLLSYVVVLVVFVSSLQRNDAKVLEVHEHFLRDLLNHGLVLFNCTQCLSAFGSRVGTISSTQSLPFCLQIPAWLPCKRSPKDIHVRSTRSCIAMQHRFDVLEKIILYLSLSNFGRVDP